MASDSIGGRWFVLGMNDMRSANIERVRPVVRARDAEDLRQLLVRERVEPYLDGGWGKVFRAGGPLEWKNDPNEIRFGGIVEVFVVTEAPLQVQIITTEQADRIPTIERATEDAARIAVIRAGEVLQ